MRKYVLGFCFSTHPEVLGQQVLLVERHDDTWQKGLVNGVGGKIKGFEDAITAMRREFLEETKIKAFVSGTYLCMVGGTDWKMHVFYAHASIPPDFKHSNDEGEYKLYSVLPPNTERTARWLYLAVLDAMENKALILGI